jgi:hypothetical protein
MAVCMEVMDRPWEWGAADCCTAACDVFLRLYGVDPMAPLRGRYSTRLGAMRLIAREGGMLAMAEGLAARAGLVASDGRAGDIGVVAFGGQLALGICTGPVWQGKSERGMAPVHQFVRAWRAA